MESHAPDSDDHDASRKQFESEFVLPLMALSEKCETEKHDGQATQGVEELGDVRRLYPVLLAPVNSRSDCRH